MARSQIIFLTPAGHKVISVPSRVCVQAASAPLQVFLLSRILTLHTETNPASCSLTSEQRAGLRNLGRLTWVCISVWPMLFACFKKKPQHIFCYQIHRVLFLGSWEGKWLSYRRSWGCSQCLICPFYSLLCPLERRKDRKGARYRFWWFSAPKR